MTTADLSLGDEGEDLWSQLLPLLSPALSGSGSAFLDTLEAAGRVAGLTQRLPLADLIEAYAAGSTRISELVAAAGGTDAETHIRRLHGLERAALTRLATGYAEGLQDAMERLRRLADESSPLDPDSGAVKPAEFGERLSLEVERCQRMDLPLGLVELMVDVGEGERRSLGHGGSTMNQLGSCLRESLRRYDSVGLTQDGAFVLVLPDISRRGLAGAAERIRRQVDACAGQGVAPAVTFALAHYDFVDTSASEMLSSLGRTLREAREGDLPLTWA
jgi:hypothetical protein